MSLSSSKHRTSSALAVALSAALIAWLAATLASYAPTYMEMRGIDPQIVKMVEEGKPVVVYYAINTSIHRVHGSCRWVVGSLCINKTVVYSVDELRKIIDESMAVWGYPLKKVPKARIALYSIKAVYRTLSPALGTYLEQAVIDLHGVAGTRENGSGITIAIIDTGVDYLHPCLRGSIKALVSVVFDRPLVWYVGVNGSLEQAWRVDEEIYNETHGIYAWMDQVGHGTHVAGLIAAHDCPIRGVAPGAKLVVIKAFVGSTTTMDRLLSAIDWLYHHAKQLGVKVLSCSWGISIPATGRDPVSLALRVLVEDLHIAVFAAAGNDGNVPMDIEAPAGAPWVIAVGAWDYWTHSLAWFSSTGPTPDMRIKPDFVCSGVNILSTYLDNGYAVMSGTSMATPICAAIYALWYQYLEERLHHAPTIKQVIAEMVRHTIYRMTPDKNCLRGWGVPLAPP